MESEARPNGNLDAVPNGAPSQASASSTSEAQSAVIVPPYWKHHRNVSEALSDIQRPPPIALEDHTEAHSETSSALWAKGVTIEDYVVVKGSKTGVGAYVVWTCKVQTLDVSA
jgi:hypothetical protein